MIINPEFFKEQCDHDLDMMDSMIDMFFMTAPGYMDQMLTALKSRNFNELKVAAHAFLSSLKIIGAQQVVDIVKQIETDIAIKKYDNLQTLTFQVKDLNTKVIEELETLKKNR